MTLGSGRQQALDISSKSHILSSATFKIEADNRVAVFSELGGISSEVEMAEYIEAGDKGPLFGRFIGKAKPPTVSLKRAMSTGPDTTWIWLWHSEARQGLPGAFKMTTLQLIPAGGDGKPAKTYLLLNAFPAKVEITGIKAGATEVVLQTVTLQCDEIIEAP